MYKNYTWKKIDKILIHFGDALFVRTWLLIFTMEWLYQPKVTTLKFVLVRVIALKPTPTLNTVRLDKYKALVLKNTARLMLVALPPCQLTIA